MDEDDILSQVSLESETNPISQQFTSMREELVHAHVEIEYNLSHVLAVLRCLIQAPSIFKYYARDQYHNQLVREEQNTSLKNFSKVIYSLGSG